MKTKVVYAIVSSPGDYYLEQAYVSILSLRHHNHDVCVTIVCDDSTRASCSDGLRAKMLSAADEVITVPLDKNISAHERSRRIKTNLRNYVSGDMFFIDSDTLVTRPIDELDSLEGDIYAVLDCHCSVQDNPYLSLILKNSANLGFETDFVKPFFNSGAMFVKDSNSARDFYRLWSENYVKGTDKGIFIDQPSLQQSLYQSGITIEELPGVWNCQVKHGTRFLGEAKVLHYLWTAKRMPSPFLLGQCEVWDSIKSTGEIPQDVIVLFDDLFKGFNGLTHICSLQEGKIFSTRLYRATSVWYLNGSRYFNTAQFFVRIIDMVNKLFKKR